MSPSIAWMTVSTSVRAISRRDDAVAVAQHRHAIGEIEHLPEAMRDVENGDAAGLQPPHDLEQAIDVLEIEGRGGLVHDQHAELADDRLRDLDQLLVRHADRADHAIGIGVDPELAQDAPDLATRLAPAHDPVSGGLGAQEDVLDDGERRNDLELLRDHRDAGLPRGQRVAERHGRAVELDPALVGAQAAAQHVDDGALAGTILADQGMDLAGTQVEVDAVEDLDPVEALAQARGAQCGAGLACPGRFLHRRTRPHARPLTTGRSRGATGPAGRSFHTSSLPEPP